MKVLVDTNIVIDALARREPFYEKARLLFILGKAGELELWISGTQLTDVFYLLTNGARTAAEKGKHLMRLFRQCVRVASFGELEFDAALDSSWEDLEDACVFQVAQSIKADAIITRNQKDFARSSIPVFDCGEFFDYLRKARNLDYAEVEF